MISGLTGDADNKDEYGHTSIPQMTGVRDVRKPTDHAYDSGAGEDCDDLNISGHTDVPEAMRDLPAATRPRVLHL